MSDERWIVDGYDLSQLTHEIETYEGMDDMPDLEGDNYDYTNRHGGEWNKKYFGPARKMLSMLVSNKNLDGTVPREQSQQRANYDRNLNKLTRVLFRPRRLLDVRRIMSGEENLVTNPSMEATSGTIEIARNYAVNPNMEATSGTVEVSRNLAAYGSAEADGASWGGTPIPTRDLTRSVGGSYSYHFLNGDAYFNVAPIPANSNVFFSYDIWIPSNIIEDVFTRIGSTWGVAIQTDDPIVERDQWVSIVISGTSDDTGGTAAIFPGISSSGEFWVDNIQVVVGAPEKYFNGDTPDDDNFTYSWVGTPHASESIKTARSINGLRAVGVGVDPYQIDGAAAIVARTNYAEPPISGLVGQYLTVVVTVSPLSFDSIGKQVGWQVHDGGSLTNGSQPIIIPSEPTVFRLKTIIPAQTDVVRVYFYEGDIAGYKVDNLLIVAGYYDGPYFHGDTQDDENYTYSWEGTPQNSISVKDAKVVSGWNSSVSYSAPIQIYDETSPDGTGSIVGEVTAITNPSVGHSIFTGGRIAVDMSKPFSAGFWVKRVNEEAPTDIRLLFISYDNTGGGGFIGSVVTTSISLILGEWIFISFEGYPDWIPDTHEIVVGIYPSTAKQSTGGKVRVAAAIAVPNDKLPIYFDGDTPGYEWAGEPHASMSRTIGMYKRADCEIIIGLRPELVGLNSGRITIDLELPNSFWEDTDIRTSEKVPPGTHNITAFQDASAPMQELTYTIFGPADNARIVDIESSAWVQYNGAIPAGGELILNSETMEVTSIGFNANPHLVQHEGDPRWITLYPSPDGTFIDFSASGTNENTGVVISGKRKFLR